MNAIDTPREPRRLVTIGYFVNTMLGMKTRQWYYHHIDEPGLPKRIYVAGRPMLLFEECMRFIDGLVDARDPPKAPKAPKVKRHRGRPAKVITPGL